MLGGIVVEATARVARLRSRAGALAALERAVAAAPATPRLRDALRREHVAVIAEVKRRSPSKGEINSALSAAEQASAYAAGGASAVSVLTEPVHFGGSVDDLAESWRAVEIPLLRKDFHVDEIQLLEARAAGASAALLIARALPPETVARLAAFARGIGLETLVEVRTDQELEHAVAIGAEIIGVNNRDLETLEMDATVRERLIPLIPPGTIAVAESGIASVSDVERAAACGADAVLVGSILSGAADPTAAVSAIARVPRKARLGR